jgi:hypothetical protein
LSILQDDIRALDASRLLPGFNFFRFFLTKENLAMVLQRFQLWEESLVLYDELETAFYQCVETAMMKSE